MRRRMNYLIVYSLILTLNSINILGSTSLVKKAGKELMFLLVNRFQEKKIIVGVICLINFPEKFNNHCIF